MHRNTLARFVVSIRLVCLGLLVFLLLRHSSLALLTMREISLDTPEAIEIQEVLIRAENILSSDNLDEFDTVLVNHPLFAQQLTREQRAILKENITRFLGPDAEFGYLNAMKAKRLVQANGRKLLEAAELKAQAQNRALTTEELAALREQNYGYTPSHIDLSLIGNRPVFEFGSVEVGFNVARVYYSRIKTNTALLVRVNGQWMVAGIF